MSAPNGTRESGSVAPPRYGLPPNDLELMLFFDGELSEARALEVEEFVAADPSLEGKLEALKLGARLSRDVLQVPPLGDEDLLESILARVDAETSGPTLRLVPAPSEVEPPSRQAPLPLVRPGESSRQRRWRRVSTGAIGALAVAASVVFWSRTRTEPFHPLADSSPAPALGPASELASAAAPAAPSAEEAPDSGGVEVAAVDFGAHAGSVFYVPGEAGEKPTAVVWLSDEGAGER